MKYTKCWIVLLAGLLAGGTFLSAKNPSEPKTEQDRLQNAGKVDVTGVFCTSGSGRESTLEVSWYADEEIQAGANCNAAAAD